MRVLIAVLPLILLFWLAVAPAHASDYPWRGFSMIRKGVDVTTVSVESPDGTMMGLGALRGSWVLLNTWAAWCAPCVAELPTLETLSRTHGIPNLKVIAVSQDAGSPHAKVLSFLKKHGVGDFAAYSDPALLLDEKLPSAGLPMTFLINPTGRVIAQYRGAADWSAPEVRQDLKRLISSGKI